MYSPNPTRTSTRNLQLVFALVLTSLLILNLWSAGAQSTAPNDEGSPATSTSTSASKASTPSGALKPSSLTLSTAALVSSVSSQTVTRSGYFKITGSNFGASQDSSSYLLVNSLAAIVVRWTDSEIAGYIPEASSLGSFPVQVATAAGTSNAINVNVTMRQTSGRIRWRVEMAGDYAENGAVVAPATVPGAGTIYVATNAGLLYAWAPDGSLKWVGQGADGDTQASIGADGTIYTGGD